MAKASHPWRSASVPCSAARARLALEPLEDRSTPAPLIVNTLADETTPGDGLLSLREAIGLANMAADADVINFQPGLSGTITLMQGQLNVAQPVTINGPGAGVITVSGNNTTRIFEVSNTFSPIDVTINGLTLTKGNPGTFGGSGGAIEVFAAALTLNAVTITGNTALGGGGISVAGSSSLTVESSTIAGNSTFQNAVGGGIAVSGGSILTVRNSTVSGNSATQNAVGGGIGMISATTTIENCTISGNMSANDGGGIWIDGGTATIRNSTVAFNTADIDNGGGGNGGGLFDVTAAAVTLQSTIVADNVVGASGLHPDIDGNVTATFSLVENQTGASFAPGSASNLTSIDPLLGPLQFNGGPTLTHALLPGSPAIDHGANPAGAAFDQRGPGFPRLSGAGVDIGAFELQQSPPPPSGQALQAAIQVVQLLRPAGARLAAFTLGDVSGDFINEIVVVFRMRNNKLLLVTFDGIDGHIRGAFQPFRNPVVASARVQLVTVNLNADPLLEIGLIVTPAGLGIPHISAFTVTGVRLS